MKEKREGVLGATAFDITPGGEINFDEKSKVAKKIMTPEEFGKKFLMDRVLNRNVRDGMDR